uniref:Uncharacterized protein n=1 Tax=Amphimedon queenslandica TaxID=400682 RepID=A0A1X7VB12_AMPQE
MARGHKFAKLKIRHFELLYTCSMARGHKFAKIKIRQSPKFSNSPKFSLSKFTRYTVNPQEFCSLKANTMRFMVILCIKN